MVKPKMSENMKIVLPEEFETDKSMDMIDYHVIKSESNSLNLNSSISSGFSKSGS